MSRQFLGTTFWFVLPCVVLAACMNAHAATPKVTTIAGGYTGDGKPATSASFGYPLSLSADAKGNLYVGDVDCRIRKINTKGVISTFVGTGICGNSGDGGPAKSATIFGVQGISFNAQGSLLIADRNTRIREASTNGIITTFAGNGSFGYSGDGGPATQASLNAPFGVSVDPSGNTYIADYGNHVIRMVDSTGVIRTVAGNHTSGFSGDGGPALSAQLQYPRCVVADQNGNFYVADSSNYRVRKVDSAGIITTYAGNGSFGNSGNGGSAASASIGFPLGLLLVEGKLFISTGSNVWSVDMATQVIHIIAGDPSGAEGFNGDGGNAVSTIFSGAGGMVMDASSDLIVTDGNNVRVRKINSAQIVTTIAGGYIGDGGRATAASLNLSPFDHIGFDSGNNLYIVDSANNRVRKVSASGIITTLAGTGITGNSGDGGPAISATLNRPSAAAVDGNGNVFIVDQGNGVVRKVDSTGTITTLPGVTIQYGGAITTDISNNIYVSDGASAIWKVTPFGAATIVAGVQGQSGYNGDGISATTAFLNQPTGVAVDTLGNLYIAEAISGRIRKVNTSGIISTIAGNGGFGFGGDGGPATSATFFEPADVAVDAKGNIYIADQFNFRVRVVNRLGTIQSLAGTGNNGYNGNNLPATSTNMFPVGLAVSPKGVVHVLDYESLRVRKIQ